MHCGTLERVICWQPGGLGSGTSHQLTLSLPHSTMKNFVSLMANNLNLADRLRSGMKSITEDTKGGSHVVAERSSD